MSTATIGSFFFNDTATTEISPLSLHDALPISRGRARRSAFSSGFQLCVWPSFRLCVRPGVRRGVGPVPRSRRSAPRPRAPRSEEHTSELQSRSDLVCRLLLEKKKHTPHYLSQV